MTMDRRKFNLALAALLHDVGKMVIRAESARRTHSAAGVDFLSRYMEGSKDVLRAVGHHHASELKSLHTSADDISYIVYEADNIASSSDRRENESNEFGFLSDTCLENIFNTFGKSAESQGGDTAFHLRGLLDDDSNMLYPREKSKTTASQAEYARLVRFLEGNFAQVSPDKMEINELLQVVEAVASYIPSSTAKGEVADISLYDHQKLTCAIACCLYDYFEAAGISDYKAQCFSKQTEALREKDTYILLSGDLSGIQNFIYTIPSKGALKSLRGRSFYLELLLENIVDDLLEQLELSRCNVLYNGGGSFNLLLPNTEKVTAFLKDFQSRINNWFLKMYGDRLYLAMGWVPCSARDFSSKQGNHLGKLYDRLRRKIQANKLSRYNTRQLSELFSVDSVLNRVADGERECSICHTSTRKLVDYEDGKLACENCSALRNLGESLLTAYCISVHDIRTSDEQVAVPSYSGECYLQAIPESKVEQECTDAIRVYVKNKILTGRNIATRLWMGDYVTRKDNHVMEFEDLAELAGGGADGTGIKRLGVMRADVDDLGVAFSVGFDKRYDTIGRSAALSRQLSVFFKRYVNSICKHGKFSLFGTSEGERNVHIIYSGGDDMFVVGTWDELIELAIDLRHAFRVFTNDKLTFSAGIGMFPAKCPVSELARVTGQMESYAKSQQGKDRVVLFGATTEKKNADDTVDMTCYTWQELEEKVCGEKLNFIREYMAIAGDDDVTKLKVGKGALYRMLGLLRDARRINLARFAYVLGRMEPAKKTDPCYRSYMEIRKRFYIWYLKKEDRKQLVTAIELMVYHIRQKGE